EITSSQEILSAQIVFNPHPSATASTESGKASLKGSESNVFGLAIGGSTPKGAITFRDSGTYHIELLDKDSLTNEHPIEYNVSLTQDEYPQVALIEPGERAELPSSMRMPMVMKIHDDFGFSHLKIGYRLRASKYAGEEKD